jgi:hypothetical protein
MSNGELLALIASAACWVAALSLPFSAFDNRAIDCSVFVI